MTYDLGNMEIKTHEKNIIGEEGTYENIRKLKSAIVSELDMLSNLYLEAFNDLEKATEKNHESRIWYSLHMMIYTQRHISELIDKIKELYEEDPDGMETQDLKSFYEDFSKLSIKGNKIVEHFGNRLEGWIEDPKNEPILENHIFEKRSIPDLDVKQMLRHFDPDTFELNFIEKSYDLRNIHREIIKIKEKVDEIYRENYLAL